MDVSNAQPLPASLDPCTLAPGNLYAVAPAPFLATVASTPHHGDDHVTLRVASSTLAAPREITVPAWFAKEFCFITDTNDSGSHGGGCIQLRAPTAGHIDQVPTRSIIVCNNEEETYTTSSPGWNITNWFSPPRLDTALPHSVEERTAFASASAGLVLAHHDAVPHDVVPALLLEHVVGPFAARVCCTMEQGLIGVVEFDGHVLPPLPNLKTLVLRAPIPADFKLPPKLQDVSLWHAERAPSLLPLTTLRCLTTLALRCGVATTDLQCGVVLQTVTTFSVNVLGRETAAERVELLSRLVPNVITLEVTERVTAADGPAVEIFRRPDVWPRATKLILNGMLDIVAEIAAARPWRHLILRTSHYMARGFGPPTPNVEPLSVISAAETIDLSSDTSNAELATVLEISSPLLRDATILTCDTEGGCSTSLAAPNVVNLTIDHCDFSARSASPRLAFGAPPAVPTTEEINAGLNALCAARPFGQTLRTVTMTGWGKTWARAEPGSVWCSVPGPGPIASRPAQTMSQLLLVSQS